MSVLRREGWSNEEIATAAGAEYNWYLDDLDIRVELLKAQARAN